MKSEEFGRRFFEKRAKIWDEKYIPKGAEELSRILIQKAGIKKGDFVLDLATGTAFQAIQIAQHVGEEGRVLGIDASEVMLKEAEKKIKGLGLERIIAIQKANADDIPLDDDSVDGVICGFSFYYFSDKVKVAGEMKRVASENDFKDIFQNVGFRDVHTFSFYPTYKGPLPFIPVMIMEGTK
jgi:SAM-dependent methyltransferase